MENKKTEIFEFLKDILGALIFLTKLPLPLINIDESEINISRAFWAFPIIGFAFGVISGGIILFFYYVGAPVFISVILGVFCLVMISGAIHEQALLSFTEGVLKGNTPDEKIQFMRENEISLSGILMIFLIFMLKISALVSLMNANVWYAFSGICCAVILGKSMIVFLKYLAIKEDEQDISSFDDRTEIIILSIALGLALFSLLVMVPFLVGIIGFIFCVLLCFIFKIIFERVLGKITGHVLGSIATISEVLFLLLFAIFYGIN